MKINDVIVESEVLDEGPFTDKLKAVGNAALNRAPAGVLSKASKLASRFGAKGTAQNLAGRASTSLTSKNALGAFQNLLGTKGIGLSNVTPELLAQFLTSRGVDVRSSDIPTNANGTVDKSTIGNIFRDVSSKSLTGEPLIYRKPKKTPMGADSTAVQAYKAKKAQSGFKGYKSSDVATAPQDTGSENYIQSWAGDIKKAQTKQEKINLARELAAFLSDRAGTPEGNRGAQQALAMLKRLEKLDAQSNKSSSQFVDPNDPADIKNQAAKLRQKWNIGGTAVPPDQQLDRNDYKKIAAAIEKGKKLSPSLRVESADYANFIKIMEMLDITLKDLNLWRVIKESTEQYVVLQTR